MLIELIDKLLLDIKTTGESTGGNYNKLQLTKEESMHYDKCIDFLVRHGYLLKQVDKINDHHTKIIYRITVEGALLVENGGYKELMRRQNQNVEKQKIKDETDVYENYLTKNQLQDFLTNKRYRHWTFIVAAAALLLTLLLWLIDKLNKS